MIKKLLQKYKQLSQPVKASLWFLLCGFVQKGMSMLTTPIYTRVMTEAEFGRSSIYASWLNILIIIASLELAAGVYTRGLVENEEDADAFSSTLLSLSTVCVLVFTVLYFAFHKWVNGFTGMNTYLMVMMIIEMLATVAYQFWSNRERVEYRYQKLVALMLSYTVLAPTFSVVAVLLADESHQVEARVTATVLVNVLLFGGLYISVMKKGKRAVSKKYWKYALLFNLPLIPHYLSQVVLNQSDRIMIDKFCGTVEAGYYSVAYSLASVMLIFNSSVSATMNPWIYRSIKEKNYKKIASVSYAVLLMIAVLNFMMITMGPELLAIMAPSSYGVAVWVIPPVTASVYFMFLYNLFATFEYYFHKTRWVMAASLLGAVSNVVLNAIFIPKYGFVAAGYTTLACYILYALAHYAFMRIINIRYMDGQKVYDGRLIVLFGLVLILLSVLMILVYPYIWIRYLVLMSLILIVICFRKRIMSIFSEFKTAKAKVQES